MRWQGRRGSSNIEDRRRSGGGGRGGVVRLGGAGGLGVLAIVVVGYFFGVDLTPLLDDQPGGSVSQSAPITQADEDAAQFVSVTLADTEEVWTKVFETQLDRTYNPPTLVLFKGITRSPCGDAGSASGPFYCPQDQKVYLDTAFFTTMEQRLGAKGDFASAYVVAHEVAHHVQDELGILSKVNGLRQQVSQADSNALSVRIELQADCMAGIWARSAQEEFGSLEPGDLDEAVNAARQIGDDTLQRNAGRNPNPHSFTHGTSQQRSKWFARGYDGGELSACDTFSGRDL
ncbi:MAG: neutral zinc metallopeptidase [Rhodobacterales bacterium]|nr:neutral zinc metallopeptidase [Rhodobacterales bacterium]